MRILIVGCGGVGGYFGGLLVRAKKDVVFLARGKNLKALRKNGLKVFSVDGNYRVKIQVFEKLPTKTKPFDLILVCVEAYHTQRALSGLKKFLSPAGVAVSLQNGVGNHQPLQQEFGKNRVLGGLCYLGAFLESPGVLRHRAAGIATLGEWDGRLTARVQNVAAELKSAKIRVVISHNVVRAQWEKLVWNVGFNGPTALLGAAVGETLDRPEMRAMVHQLMDEAVTLGRASRVKLAKNLPQKIIKDSWRNLKTVETSMWRDRQLGRPLEIDIFQGFICRAAQRHKIPTPMNHLVLKLLEGISH